MLEKQSENDEESIRSRQSIELGQEELQAKSALNLNDPILQSALQSSLHVSKSRLARIARLQAMVQAGTYQVDSMALAQSMLDNETHFNKADSN